MKNSSDFNVLLTKLIGIISTDIRHSMNARVYGYTQRQLVRVRNSLRGFLCSVSQKILLSSLTDCFTFSIDIYLTISHYVSKFVLVIR